MALYLTEKGVQAIVDGQAPLELLRALGVPPRTKIGGEIPKEDSKTQSA